MKKSLIIFLLLLIPIAAAQPDLIFQNQTFQPGETLLGTINAQNIIEPITKEKIEFFRGQRAISLEHDLTSYNNTYFLYTILPDTGNITIRIKDILYKAPELKSKTIEKQIQIQENFLDENKTQTQILQVKPGFLFTSETPELTLSNKGTQELEINYNEETISIPSNDFKKISFIPEKTFSYLTLSTYKEFKIPIIYISLTNQTPQILQTKLKSNPSSIKLKTTTNNQSHEKIELINFAETNITDISISTTLPIVEFESPQQIPAKEIYPLTISFFSIEQGFFTGELAISFLQTEDSTSEQKTISIPLEVYVFPENANLSNIQTSETCADLFGQVCTEDQICELGDTTFDSNGDYCCIGGICEDLDSDSKGSSTWLIGIIIIVVVGIISFFIYRKVKKTKPKQVQEKFQEKSKLYEKRVSGKISKE